MTILPASSSLRSLEAPRPSSCSSSNPSTHIANSVFCRGPLVPGHSSISERGEKKSSGRWGEGDEGREGEKERESLLCGQHDHLPGCYNLKNQKDSAPNRSLSQNFTFPDISSKATERPSLKRQRNI